MSPEFASRTVRLAALVALVALASLTGCSSGINTMTAPTTPTRMSHYGTFPIDDPSPAADWQTPPVVGRGYGYGGG
jgi:hypothetical protein